MSESSPNGWIKVYHPAGVMVTLPVFREQHDYTAMFANVGNAIAAGFLAREPGLEAGEQKEQCGYVLRRSKDNGADRPETPIVDLYSPEDRLTWKFLSVYLNRDEDVAAFERASGLRLDSLPLFNGTSAPERGSSRSTDKFITKAPHEFGVVMKPNPKHNPAETDVSKKKPKLLFVRWDGQQAASPQDKQQPQAQQPQQNRPQPQQQGQPGQTDKRTVDGLRARSECLTALNMCPNMDEYNKIADAARRDQRLRQEDKDYLRPYFVEAEKTLKLAAQQPKPQDEEIPF